MFLSLNDDKEETRKFVFDTLKEMSDDCQFSNEDFEKCFKEFDEDNSGTIEKQEMVVFIKRVAGLCWKIWFDI